MTGFAGIAGRLEGLAVEVPSWAYGNSGTRFKVFGSAGTPRSVWEKVADAAVVHRFTGLAPSVALHIPWDRVEDWGALRGFAEDLGVRLGTVNSNTFQDEDYRLGSLTNADPKVRLRAVEHNLECLEVMGETGSRDLKVWLADGTNYPGQGDMRARQDWLAEGLAAIYARLGEGQRLVLEYKFFEPAFYHTDVPDWGTSYVQVAALGERAMVCLDTGHHAPGTNIEFIVAQLLRLGRLGSFDFNSRFYADDDLMVGAADPFQLFRILVELIRARWRVVAGWWVGWWVGWWGGVDVGPVSQHRGEDPGPDPVGAHGAGDDGAGVAAGRGRVGVGPGVRGRAGREPGVHGRLLHRRPSGPRGVA